MKGSWSNLEWLLPGANPHSCSGDDFRRCTDSETYPLNLMLFTGLPKSGWQDYWYTSVSEISRPREGALPVAEGLSGLSRV